MCHPHTCAIAAGCSWNNGQLNQPATRVIPSLCCSGAHPSAAHSFCHAGNNNIQQELMGSWVQGFMKPKVGRCNVTSTTGVKSIPQFNMTNNRHASVSRRQVEARENTISCPDSLSLLRTLEDMSDSLVTRPLVKGRVGAGYEISENTHNIRTCAHAEEAISARC